MLNRIKALFRPTEQKADVYNILRELNPQSAIDAPSFTKLAQHGYAANPYVLAAVRERAMAVAGIPWCLQQLTNDGEPEDVDDHDLLRLWTKPNQSYGLPRLLEKLVSYLDLSGNGYLYGISASGDPEAPPDEIWCIPPQLIEPVVNEAYGLVTGYKLRKGASEIILAPSSVLHLAYFNPNDPHRGLSPLASANRSIELNNSSKDFNVALLKNFARPSGALIFKGDLTQAQFERAKADLDNSFAGANNAGRPRIFQGDVRWEQFGLSPTDISWLDGQKLSAKEICIALQVPPELIGENESKTFCLPAATRISTPIGPRPISEIKVGDLVWSESDGKQVQKKVVASACVGEKQTYRVSMAGRSLVATGNHPVLVRRQLTSGVNQLSKPVFKHEYVPVDTLRIGDVLVVAYQYPQLSEPIGPEVDTDVLEFFGAMLGDGFSKIYEGSNAVISMSGNKGLVRDFYQSVMSKIWPNNKIQIREREVRISSVDGVRWLDKLGLSGYAKTKRIPQWVYTRTREERTAFLRGLLDTDGSVGKNGVIAFGVNNEQLCRDVRDLAISLGLSVSDLRHEIKIINSQKSVVQGLAEIWRFALTSPALNVAIGARCPKDLRRLEEGAKDRPFRGRKRCFAGTLTIEPPENCEYRTVTGINSVAVEPVYDIEVEDSHNFFAEHILVHNSNYMEARKAFYQETVLPMLDWIQAEVNRWLVPRFDANEQLKLVYDAGDIEALQDDRAAAVDTATKAYQSGLMTRNEARGVLGLDEDDSPESSEFKEPQALGFGQGPQMQLSAKASNLPKFWGPNQLRTFNANTIEEKAAQFQAVENIRERYEFAVRSAVREQFRSERNQMARALRSAQAISQAQAITEAITLEQRKPWLDLLTSIYVAVGEDFAAGAYRDFGRGKIVPGKSSQSPPETKSPQDSEEEFLEQWRNDVAAYVQTEGAQMVENISNATLRKLKKIIQSAMDEGTNVRDVERAIDDLYLDEIIPNRSEVIARTEVIRASNLGSQKAAQNIGKNVGRGVYKQWLSTRDSRTRDLHLSMDGSEVLGSGNYLVAGESMRFPGDSSLGASPGNTIQCRCTETYRLAEEDDEQA